jgi:uncharacterized protein
MKALSELSIRSPLKEYGLTKHEIRRLSKEAGLVTWNKPAYACLATRVQTGKQVTTELLAKIEASEDTLFSMGFSDFRVRVFEGVARLQFISEHIYRAFQKREDIKQAIKPYFTEILLDLDERQKGCFNE